MPGTQWICFHCHVAAYITTAANVKLGWVDFALPNAEGPMGAQAKYTVCSNPDCKRTTVEISVWTGHTVPQGFLPRLVKL